MPSLKERIIKVLLSEKLVTKEQLEEAFEQQRQHGGSLQTVLIEKGFVKEAALMAVYSQGLGIPPINLRRIKLDPNLKGLITRNVAKQCALVPVSCIGQTLTVAMADPLNVMALDTVTTMTGLRVNTLLATMTDINEAIDQYYGTGVEETLKEMVTKAEAESLEIVTNASKDGVDAERLLSQVQEAPVVKFTDAMLTTAVRLRASDLLLEPREKTIRVRYRVDGVLQEGAAPPKALHEAIVSRIKVMSELNIAERRIPLDGHFRFSVEDRRIDFRVSILPSAFGGTVCLRILDKGAVKLDIDTLGFSERDLTELKACARRPHGLILSTGPVGSGKTTTLYALLELIDSPDKNLVTVEDPVEFDLVGINQVNTRQEIGLTFSIALRSILRQDPDIIMVGEIRDSETADMAIKSSLTGHLVLSTLHTNSAAGSIIRLTNMGLEPFLINSCLMAVVGQRLVRKMCRRCAKGYQPSKKLVDQLHLAGDDGKVPELLRPEGCRSCLKTGYAGRVVIAETLVMTPAIRELVLKRAPQRELEVTARREGMQTLREHGVEKAVARITSLEEVFRTTIGQSVDT